MQDVQKQKYKDKLELLEMAGTLSVIDTRTRMLCACCGVRWLDNNIYNILPRYINAMYTSTDVPIVPENKEGITVLDKEGCLLLYWDNEP